MQKPTSKTSRRTTRSTSNQNPTEQATLGVDDSRRPSKERDDTGQPTPQSTTETSISISAPEDPYLTTRYLEASTPGEETSELDFTGDFSGYVLTPGGPLMWDWGGSVAFSSNLATFYEPLGELGQQLQNQQILPQEFSIPHPVWAKSAPGGSPLFSINTLASAELAESAGTGLTATPPKDPSMLAGMKRKADSDSSQLMTGSASVSTSAKRQSILPEMQASSTSGIRSPGDRDSPRRTLVTAATPVDADQQLMREKEPTRPSNVSSSSKRAESSAAASSRKVADISAILSPILPAGKVFPIRIGSELFQLSGAAISSDAPSYLSHFFGEQLLQNGGKANSVKTLYIDRDPSTFRDISMHLQGYHVKPEDGAHYVRLFADAQFYSLPRLTQQLFKSEIFIQVGERHFQIPRDLFSSPGDLPNFFSLGFAHFFSAPKPAIPGLDGQALLRPPSILPPAVPNRSGETFADILRILQGYDVKVRDEAHRAELLRDARYFHLKGVEQKLLPCDISFNLHRDRSEIVLRLEDLRQSGISFSPDPGSLSFIREGTSTSKPATPHSNYSVTGRGPTGWISYQRPFIDDEARELILEIGPSESTRLDVSSMRATFVGQSKARISSLFQVIANKMNLPATLPLGLMMMQSGGGVAAQPISPANSGVSGDRVRVKVGREALVELDGEEVEWEDDEYDAEEEEGTSLPTFKKWIEGRDVDMSKDWMVQRALWRLRVESNESGKIEVVICVVKMQAYTDERIRNKTRNFLT